MMQAPIGERTETLWSSIFFDSSLWTGLCSSGKLGRGKAKRPVDNPVDKHLGPPFYGTRCASDHDASSYWREHWLLTELIDIGFSVGTYHAIWSQSGNNKTVQRMLRLFKSCYQGRTTRSSQKTHIMFRKPLSWSLASHNAIFHSWCSFGLSCASILQCWICKSLPVIIFKHSAKKTNELGSAWYNTAEKHYIHGLKKIA